MNTAWHEKHRLEKGASMKERVVWHVAHRKACGCRSIPASVESELEGELDGEAESTAVKPRASVAKAKTKPPAKPVAKRRRVAPTPAMDPRFAPIVSALAKERGVTYGGKGFVACALKVDDKVFAMMSAKGEFVAKLTKARVEQLVRAKQGKYFDAGRGRLMREWLSVTGSPSEWLVLAKEALAFGRES